MHHHGAGLRRLLSKRDAREREALLEALIADHREAQLSAADRAMLDYAARLTTAPSTVTRADCQGLRDQGFDDRAVHDICSIAAYFAFVNRIADGLGVEVE